MKRYFGTILAALLVIGGGILLLTLVLHRADPAEKWMKEHPYTFETARDLGKEHREAEKKNGGVLWQAYPQTGVAETDRKLRAVAEGAAEQFDSLCAAEAEKEKKERQIPRLVCDYTAVKGEKYTEVRTFSDLGYCEPEGEVRAVSSTERVYYVDAENRLMDLDGVIGENTIKKLEIMLRKTPNRIAELQDFTVKGDQLSLRWAEGEQIFSVSEIRRASLIDPDKPMVALTFDDGPGGLSRDFADLLAKYNAHGTFFVLGSNVGNFADDVKYVYEAGNEIGSHTMNHRNLNMLSESGIRAEIDDAAEAIEEATGVKPVLVRTPYGNANKTVRSILNGPMISWSVDTEDWKSRNAQAVRREIVNGIYDGAIILMHEIYGSTYDGLALALEDLKDEGYQYVTVSELMQYRGGEPEARIYYDFPPEKED